jgi:hypothetical protein
MAGSMDTERKQWPDDVLRVKDEMDMHAVLGQKNQWVAFALADGQPLDHAAYPTWNDAVKAAKWDRDNYIYLEVQPDGMPYKEASAVLRYARTLHKMGYRIPDPDWTDYEASVMPRLPADRRLAARQLITGTPIYPDNVSYGNLPQRKDR